MAFVVSSLTNYVSEQSKELLTAAVFQSETAALAQVQPGIKTAEKLQLLNVDVTFQDGAGCSFNAAGDATFSQRTLTVAPIKVQSTLCPSTLETKWTQLLLRAGSTYTEADIPAKILDDEVILKLKAQLETADWKGDTNSGVANTNKYDGICKIVSGSTGVNNVGSGASTLTTSNVRVAVQNAIATIPAAQMGNENFTLFCGYDVWQMYVMKLGIDNLYHISGKEGSFGEVPAENSIYKLKAVHGLDGQNSSGKYVIVGIDATKNLFMGCDMVGEEDKFDMWESKDDQDIKYSIKFKRGWQVAYPSEIVTVTNS